MRITGRFILLVLVLWAIGVQNLVGQSRSPFRTAVRNARLYDQYGRKVERTLSALLKEADAVSLLVPDYFNPKPPPALMARNRRLYTPHNSGAGKGRCALISNGIENF